MRLLGTGVTLRLANERFDKDPGSVEAQVFVECEDDGGGRWRSEGPSVIRDVPSGDGDPTTDLLGLAQHQRDANLGVLLGDLRRAGYDVTRWSSTRACFE